MFKTRLSIFIFTLLLGLYISNTGWAQNKIFVQAENQPLSTILNNISLRYYIRFAYNEDVFSQIQTSLKYENVSIDDFLESLCAEFGLKYKEIGGTYVIYIDDEKKIEEAIKLTAAKNKRMEESSDTLHTVEDFTISGVITNSKTGDKINYCGLSIEPSYNAITNEMGFFSVTIPPVDSIGIRINHLGYQPVDTIIALEKPNSIEIQLKPIELIPEMKGLSIRSFKFIVALPDVPEIIEFNPRLTLQVPAIEPNDLMNALTVLPGINYLKGIETGLSIRGGAPSDNLILIDGIPVIETSHLMGNLSILNSKYIQQVFVSRGGFGAQYGGRTAGIVDLTGRSGNNDRPVTDFTANQLHTNIYVGLPITEKSSLSGSFKKSFVDVWSDLLQRNFDLEQTVIDADGASGNSAVDLTKMNYTDANLKLSLRPNLETELTFNVFSSYDEQQRNYSFPIDGNYTQENYTNSSTLGYSFNYKYQKPSGWMNTFTIGYNKLENVSLNEYAKVALVEDQLVKPFFDGNNITIGELRSVYHSEFKGRKFTHQYGLGFNSNHLNLSYEDYEIKILGANNFNDSITARSSVNLANSYYQLKFFPLKWISLRAGVRGLYNFNRVQFSLQPRYGVEIFPMRNLRFHYSGGRYVQHMYLAYRVDSYHNTSQIWYIPTRNNENLDATHHIVGSRLELKHLLLNVEAYQKVNKNKAYFIGENGVKNGLKVVNYTPKLGEELNRGVDVFLQYQTSIFKHLVSYSLSESFERTPDINDNAYFPSIDHQLHRLRLTEIVNYKGWTASVNWYIASGTPYLMNSSTSTQLDFAYHPNYRQLDVSLVKQFQFNNFYFDLGITVLNVADRKNEIANKNLLIPEGNSTHTVNVKTISTSFSPLFYVNLRYE